MTQLEEAKNALLSTIILSGGNTENIQHIATAYSILAQSEHRCPLDKGMADRLVQIANGEIYPVYSVGGSLVGWQTSPK